MPYKDDATRKAYMKEYQARWYQKNKDYKGRYDAFYTNDEFLKTT